MFKKLLSVALLVALLFTFASCSSGISVSTFMTSVSLNSGLSSANETVTFSLRYSYDFEDTDDLPNLVVVTLNQNYAFDSEGYFIGYDSIMSSTMDGTALDHKVSVFYDGKFPDISYKKEGDTAAVVATTKDKFLDKYNVTGALGFKKDDLSEFTIAEDEKGEFYLVKFVLKAELFDTYLKAYFDLAGFDSSKVENDDIKVSAKIDVTTKIITEYVFEMTLSSDDAGGYSIKAEITVALSKIGELTEADFTAPTWTENAK